MKKLLLSSALAIGTIAGAASANTVTVQYQQPGGVFGTNNLKQNITVSSPGHNGGVQAGLFHMTGDNGFGDFLAFCVDLAQYLHDPTVYTEQSSWFGADVVSNVKKLFNSALGGDTVKNVIDTSVEAAGFQVALWEVLYDTSQAVPFDLTGGNFSVSGNAGAQAQAQTYLNGLPGTTADDYDLTWLFSSTKQDVIIADPRPDSGPSPVPLPAAGLLMLGGLGGLAALRRRRKAA